MKYFLILAAFGLLPQDLNAEIICKGKTNWGNEVKVVLDIEKQMATVTSKHLSEPQVYEKISIIWDGHMTGLVTSKKFSMTYENHFACIRNVIVTTVVQDNGSIATANFSACRGESPHDDLCWK